MIDETDRKLLNYIIRDGRQSFRKLAGRMGVSTATTIKRIQQMKSEGIITGYGAIIDYEKLGYDLQAIISMRISKGKLFQVEEKIAHMASVFAVYDVTGDFDSMIVARFTSRKALDRFLKKIQAYDFVERTNTVIVLNTIKEEQTLV